MLAGVRLALRSLLVAGLLGGCGGGDEQGNPEPVTGAPKQVAETVAKLERATVTRDFRTICEELFSPVAREQAGGEDCADSLRGATSDLRGPRIRLLSIRIDGERASARVRTLAEGQAAVDETIELVREDGRYLIAALGG